MSTKLEREILELLDTEPGLTPNGVSKRLQVDHVHAKAVLTRLRDQGALTSRRERDARYGTLSERFQIAREAV